MKLKSVILSLTCVAMLFSFAGCGKGNESSKAEGNSSEAVSEKKVEAIKGDMRGLDAVALVADMKTGWNLGNSLDATGGDETEWGNVVTTKQMIDEVKNSGFDVLRVPVTWYEHLSDDYTIDKAFLDRVQEVVNYGIENDMYVILNTHHETDTWLVPDDAHYDNAKIELTSIWKQLCERFGEYGDKLVFEGMNEPRTEGSAAEWNGGTAEERAVVNKLNKDFVDTVRASGGNNAQRLLLITTYANSVTNNPLADLEIPEDKYIGVSLHAYTPYSFTYHSGESYETFKWDGSEENSINTVFSTINNFLIARNIPVIITEYGAVTKELEDGSSNTEEVVKWVQYYLEQAESYGIPCVWWDNGYYISGNELFGIFDRSKCSWFVPEVKDAIMDVFNK